ncbi:MAG: response regulator [Planctomycetes bacterium]|nr:response regulator [Planctomycetota bacterium]
MSTDAIPRVLWIDDDAPRSTVQIPGVELQMAYSCADAIKKLATHTPPDVIVVDISLSLDGWRADPLTEPGIHLMRHLRETLGPRQRIISFSHYLDTYRHALLDDTGVKERFQKRDFTLKSLLAHLRAPGPTSFGSKSLTTENDR